jgi:hypothetical protein
VTSPAGPGAPAGAADRPSRAGSGARKLLVGCGVVAALVGAALVAGVWWFLRGGPVGERFDLVGPRTQAFVTFLAVPEDKALQEVVDSLRKRPALPGAEKHAEWMGWFGDLLSGARVYHVRASALVESLEGGDSQVGAVVSLGRMANVVRMLVGISDSERESETYRGERIVHGRETQDLCMSFVGNSLVLSRDVRVVKSLIDKLKKASADEGPSDSMSDVLRELDGSEPPLPGAGALLNDRASVASLWQMVSGAPEGAEISLPENFRGVGFRFGFASADVIKGDGYFYFGDEEAAQGGTRQIEAAIQRLCAHFRLEPQVILEQQGSRLHVVVEARGVQRAIDHLLTKGL